MRPAWIRAQTKRRLILYDQLSKASGGRQHNRTKPGIPSLTSASASGSSFMMRRYIAARSRTSSSTSSRHLKWKGISPHCPFPTVGSTRSAYLVRRTRILFLTVSSPTLMPNLARAETAAARTIAFSRTTLLYMYLMYFDG